MSHEHFWEVCLPIKDGEIPTWKCDCGATEQKEFPILDIDSFEKKEDLKEGTKVETDLEGGMQGEIVGIADNGNVIIGKSYIIKIVKRNGNAWKKYQYSCVALPENLLREI